MIVLVQCSTKASQVSQKQFLQLDVLPTDTIGSLKSLAAEQLGAQSANSVLSRHGLILGEDDPVSTLVEQCDDVTNATSVVQLLTKPPPRQEMLPRVASGCSCHFSKFALAPALPALNHLIEGHAESITVMRKLLCNQMLMTKVKKHFQCPVCSDTDLAQAFDAFLARVSSSDPNLTDIFSLCERRTHEIMARVKSFMEQLVFITKVALQFPVSPLSVSDAREVFTLDNYETFVEFVTPRPELSHGPLGLSIGSGEPLSADNVAEALAMANASFAAAAAATTATTGTAAVSGSSTATTSASSLPSAARTTAAPAAAPISADMFQQALSAAMRTGGRGGSRSSRSSQSSRQRGGGGGGSSGPSLSSTLLTRFRVQLGVMRTMGLTDDSHSIQALMATDGDVNAAVDLLMSGALS
eukprot:scpid93375/ scgid9516/ 